MKTSLKFFNQFCNKQNGRQRKTVMRLQVLIFFLFLFVSVRAQRDFEFSYSQNSFTVNDTQGLLQINSNLPDYRRAGDLTCPNFQYFPLRVLLPAGWDELNYEVEFDKRLLRTGVRIEANMPAVTTNGDVVEMGNPYATSSVSNPVCDGGIVPYGKFKYLYLKISPFLFDAATGSLYFVPRVKIHFPDLPASSNNMSADPVPNAYAGISSLVSNAQDAVFFYPNAAETTFYEDPVDYLIITSRELVNSFDSLRIWKTWKGLYTRVVAVEDICNSGKYSGSDDQAKIKACIMSYQQNHGTKFVLLGGDDTIVPSRKCKYKKSIYLYDTVPTDAYYSCFNAQFMLDSDGIVVGNSANNINFNYDVCLSRLPVRNVEQVQNYIQKLFRYERDIPEGVAMGANKLLLTGDTNDGYHSPTKLYNDTLCMDYINPYWSGEIYYMYEDSYNLPNGDSYCVNADNLKKEINRGYNLIHECSHGSYNSWRLMNTYYNTAYANAQNNTIPSVFVTIACHTNAFDYEPCLSESLIRNVNGGAIAYFGSSREGYSTKCFDMSFMYDAHFFKNLFSGQSSAPYSFGTVATKAKLDMKEESIIDGINRYLQFFINPIGDPEMQIHTGEIMSFVPTNGILTYNPIMFNISTHSLYINAGVDSCKVVVVESNGKIHVKENVRSATFSNLTDTCHVSILKHNFRPYLSEVIMTDVGSSPGPFTLNISSTGNYLKDVTLVKFEMTDEGEGEATEAQEVEDWNIEVMNVITGERKVSQKVDGTTYQLNTLDWSPGVYVVRATNEGESASKKLSVK